MAAKKILIVDDDQGVTNIIKASLRAEDREFMTAADGVEAVEMLQAEQPDLVILDIMMPRMDGYQVCRLIKNDRSTWDIPVILLTAKDKTRDREYGMSVGADDYIVKPFHPRRLSDKVDELLKASSGRKKDRPPERISAAGQAVLLSKVNSLLDRKLQEMTFLNEMTRAMTSTFDEDEILDSLISGVGRYLGYERVIVFVTDDDGRLVERKEKGYPRHEDRYVYSPEENDSFGEVMENKHPLVMDGRWLNLSGAGGPAVAVDSPVRAYQHAVVPIVAREEVRGILLIDRHDGEQPFSDERLGVLTTLAGQLGLALENARLYRKMLMMSVTDGLTGLFNARYFYERLETEISRARRYQRPLTLFMLDLDYFKRYNDTYGHLCGDDALKSIAGILRQNSRTADTVARYGGEEFCMILPETDAEHARSLAERVRETVENTELDPTGTGRDKMTITVSIGVAGFHDDIDTAEDMVRFADLALYGAKELGRNRVCVFGDENCRVPED